MTHVIDLEAVNLDRGCFSLLHRQQFFYDRCKCVNVPHIHILPGPQNTW